MESSPLCFKVVVVGDAAVGKSCLLYRLRYGDMPSGHYSNTIGCEFSSHVVRTQEFGVVKLFLWDTAGHDSFRSFIPNFLRGAHASLVCVNVDRENMAVYLEQWINETRRCCPGVSVIGVLTKMDTADLCGHNDDKEEMIQNTMKSLTVAFYRKTSSLTGDGVTSLFDDIAVYLASRNPTQGESRGAHTNNQDRYHSPCPSCLC